MVLILILPAGTTGSGTLLQRTMAERLSILVAEDDSHDMRLLKIAFAKAGVQSPVYFVRNGAEAMDYLSGKPPFNDRGKYPYPDLLLLDLKMPGVDGFELLSQLKNATGLGRVTVAAMSGSCWQQDFERARDLGAALCLDKSIELLELIAAIKHIANV